MRIPPPSDPRECVICGESYQPNSSQSQTCSLPCRKMLYGRRYERKRWRGNVQACAVCKGDFTPVRSKQKFCSDVCKVRSYCEIPADPEGCWSWNGHRDKDGYGLFQSVETLKTTKGHAATALASLPAPDHEDAIACHHCDNPQCCNPRHLYWGTHKTNSDDKWNRGRAKPTPPALTRSQSIQIRRFRERGDSLKELAERFDVSLSLISHICTGRRDATYPDW